MSIRQNIVPPHCSRALRVLSSAGGLLTPIFGLPTSFAAKAEAAWRNGCRSGVRRSHSMLLLGGCGYEDLRLLSPLSLDRRL